MSKPTVYTLIGIATTPRKFIHTRILAPTQEDAVKLLERFYQGFQLLLVLHKSTIG